MADVISPAPAKKAPQWVLGLTPTYSAADLNRAWRAFARVHHPDRGGDPAVFTRGRAAHETLRAR